MQLLGLLVMMLGGYLLDSAVRNRPPVRTIQELIADPSDLSGTLAKLNGTWVVFDDSDPVLGTAASGTGSAGRPAETGDSGHLKDSDLVQLSWAPGQKLEPNSAADLEKLNKAYKARFGSNISVTDSYRSYAAQVRTKALKGALAATPGKSVHGWGRAVDLGGLAYGNEKYEWLRTNGPKFGWDNPTWARQGGTGSDEPWHWEHA